MADTSGHVDPKAYRETFTSDGVISPKRIVVVGAADDEVAEAANATAKPAGVSTNTSDTADADHVDVIRHGPAEVTFGGTVAAFEMIMATTDGKAIAFSAGAGNYAVGQNGGRARASGDVAQVYVNINLAGA